MSDSYLRVYCVLAQPKLVLTVNYLFKYRDFMYTLKYIANNQQKWLTFFSAKIRACTDPK